MKRYKFEEFEKIVVEQIKTYLPEKYADSEVSIHNVQKNNNVQRTGLTIRKMGSTIAPTIYLEQFYWKYENDMNLESILKEIAELRVENEVEEDFDLKRIVEFENCKDKIIPRLIGTENNTNILTMRPYRIISDLAVTYCILIDWSAEEDVVSIPITNQIMETWKIDVDMLHKIALENQKRLLPPKFRGMTEVISNIIGYENEVEKCAMFREERMYVLTNSKEVSGASAMLDYEIMEDILERIGCFYILPSSVHEVLIIPQKSNVELEALKGIVNEVNETTVEEDEILSSNVYTYTPEEGICIAE